MSGPSTAPPGLRDVHEATRLGPYLRGVWSRRSYIWYVANNELHSRQMKSVLGNLWHLLNPMLQIGVYYLIFGKILEVDRGVDNFIAFLTVGVFVFAFTQRATTAGATSIVNNHRLLRSISFPRAVLPITSTVTEAVATIPTIGVMVGVLLITGETPAVRWLVLVPVLALQFMFNSGAALIAARVTAHLRDVQQILPFVFRILIYGSAVLFSADAYTSSDSALRWFFYLNPIYCFITLARWSVLGSSAEGPLVVSAAIWSVVLLVAGFQWFRSAEDVYGRD